MANETDRKRRAAYLAKAITRNDKAAIQCLESEFAGEAARVKAYREAYYSVTHPQHTATVEMVSELYSAAGDWREP
jgi:hypothetical protein